MRRMCWRWMTALAVLAASGSASAQDIAAAREERFMQACMTDATVAAGQRMALCRCVRDEFAYGGQTSFGFSDVLTLDEHLWESPDRRLPRDSLGQEVRRIRQACLKSLTGQRPPAR